MSLDLRQQLQQTMQVKVTPKQIAANYILQMSSVELQEAISQELRVQSPDSDRLSQEPAGYSIVGLGSETPVVRRVNAPPA